MTATDTQPELLPCPFCGNERPNWVGSADGDYVECGSCLATMPPHDPEVPNETARWNTRLTSATPTLGDMVMVPRAIAEKLAKFATEWDRWQAKGSTSTERMVRFSYGQARIELADFRAVHEALSAAPASPIPTSVANEGERKAFTHAPWHHNETIEQYRERMTGKPVTNALVAELRNPWEGLPDGLGRKRGELPQWAHDLMLRAADRIAALSPALDNTAVEGLRDAAREVLKHRVGEQPTRGYLRDNDRSRTALTALAAALAAVQTEKA